MYIGNTSPIWTRSSDTYKVYFSEDFTIHISDWITSYNALHIYIYVWSTSESLSFVFMSCIFLIQITNPFILLVIILILSRKIKHTYNYMTTGIKCHICLFLFLCALLLFVTLEMSKNNWYETNSAVFNNNCFFEMFWYSSINFVI